MKILVIGDTILDKYVLGKTERVNPEAPSLVLDYETEDEYPGGACNVVANIRTLTNIYEPQIDYYGFASMKIKQMLEQYSAHFLGISCTELDILTKTRFVAQNQHLLRLDRNKVYDTELCLVSDKFIRSHDLSQYDLIVVSDYAKGTFTEAIANKVFEYGGPVLIDLKKFRDWLFDFNLSNCIFKCNLKEYEENGIADRLEYSTAKALIVTLGKSGYSIIKPSKIGYDFDSKQYPAIKLDQNVIDVVGAGDCFLAGMVAQFVDTKEFDAEAMAAYGNKAAAAKIQKFGTKTVTRDEISNS